MDEHNPPPVAPPPETDAAPTPPSPQQRTGRRWLRRVFVALVALISVPVLALAALLVWAHTEGSLAQTLSLLSRYLPASQTLTASNVTGTLAAGGQIGTLHWQQGALDIRATQAELRWQPQALLHNELRLTQLQLAELHINDSRTANPTSGAPPLAWLQLPLRVDSPFSLGQLDLQGRTVVNVRALQGHYRFDGLSHQLDSARLQLAAGQYQLQGRVQAQSPMALTLAVQGQVPSPLPSADGAMVMLHASAHINGPLAGDDATLAVTAQLNPPEPAAPPASARSAPRSATTSAQASAQIQPWHAQPIAQAAATWQALDLASLWPQAPRTQLSGSAHITPEGAAANMAATRWQAQLELRNTQPGPWNQQRLPVTQMQLQASYLSGAWVLQSLQAKGAGGQLTGQGQASTAHNALAWQGQIHFQGLNPALIDTRLAPAALDGQLSAQQASAASALGFTLELHPASRQPAAPGADALLNLARGQLRRVQASGQWLRPVLQVQQFSIDTSDAQLQTQGRVQTAPLAVDGQLSLRAPGLEAQVAGQISANAGQGELHLNLTEAQAATRWLAQWPGLDAALAGQNVQGQGRLDSQWRGGWAQQGAGLQLHATLNVPRLAATASADEPAWRVRDLQAELNGTPAALTLELHGAADVGTRQFDLRTQAEASRQANGAWQARINSAKLEAQLDATPGSSTPPPRWSAQLSQALRINWQADALQLSSAQLRLTGPAPGTALINLGELRWARAASGRSSWHSQGQVQGLPLGWLEVVSGNTLANAGLNGDLVFGGPWDVSWGDKLRLRATLARTSGDLRLQAEDERTATLSAGVTQASLALSADDAAVSAQLRWATSRAGQAQVDVKTQLQPSPSGWSWPANAPVSGTVRAQLPRVGVWSVLAPPGWRLRGTLDAQLALSGTRSAPQWRGTLNADDLAVRSVVEGIEFRQGTLRASLDGQRLNITRFNLLGASTASDPSGGGQLSAQGFVQWPPATDASASSALMRLRMTLEVQAQKLRLSSRVDRRLAVSGQLTAQLSEAQLRLRGQLTADQALIILPDDSAPRLGDDVRIRPSRSAPAAATATTTASAGIRISPDIDLTLNLGPDFQLRGRGLSTRLAGSLNLRTSAGHSAPQLSGEIRTIGGSYRAYSQQLQIETGVLRFTGPYDNPSLDVLAIRPNLSQRVGVQITGTALLPRVRLYADTDMTDAEKISWLMLGRAAANGGAEAAVLQQAALALLGGNGKGISATLAESLGLDELSVHGSTTSTDGTTTGAAVTLGKRLSSDFYVAYERSLSGTLGTFYIFYDLSRRFTLRAQTGEHSAVDLIFTLRYD